MEHFSYKDNSLLVEDASIASIAERYGTPCFIYSKAALEQNYQAYEKAFEGHSHLICYAVKANSNLAVLNVLAKLGAGFDIVSGGELDRVIAAGGDTKKVTFSGLGKTTQEIYKALDTGIHCFNIESEAELFRINEIAVNNSQVAPISIRVNPDVNAETHPYISTGLKENKFGLSMEKAIQLYLHATKMKGIFIKGLDFHIGSQLTSIKPILDALDRILTLNDQLISRDIIIEHINIGGGLGVTYEDEMPPTPNELILAVKEKLHSIDLKIVVEPGRSIAANAGILVTKVEYLKNHEEKNFAIIDGAMNDLIRPALYGAWQKIVPVKKTEGNENTTYDIVGPICESADVLGKSRSLYINAGDLLAIKSAGAYGFVMSSNYNTRPRAPEIMISGSEVHLIRERETVSDLFQNEYLLPN
ncbi:MAG: diaminopimelate decarboxylase [Gammaproteobacteria bacterium]|nr:diaminopimelate decarboxylase [Gammaproteobacteria bacterium]